MECPGCGKRFFFDPVEPCGACGFDFHAQVNSQHSREPFPGEAAEALPASQVPSPEMTELSELLSRIRGVEGMEPEELCRLLYTSEAQVVTFQYCISFIRATITRSSRMFLVRKGASRLKVHWPYTLTTLLLGWWGIPFGPIRTLQSLIQNLSTGGDDKSYEVILGLRAIHGEQVLPLPERPGVGDVFISTDGGATRKGPLTQEQFLNLHGTGRFKEGTLVWGEGDGRWRPVGELAAEWQRG